MVNIYTLHEKPNACFFTVKPIDEGTFCIKYTQQRKHIVLSLRAKSIECQFLTHANYK